MECPRCNEQCRLVIDGYDDYGVIRHWFCMNCTWTENDPLQEGQSE